MGFRVRRFGLRISGEHRPHFSLSHTLKVYDSLTASLALYFLTVTRDGLEDWELFRQVKDKPALATLLRSVVRSASDWTTDPHAIELARRAALAMVAEQAVQY